MTKRVCLYYFWEAVTKRVCLCLQLLGCDKIPVFISSRRWKGIIKVVNVFSLLLVGCNKARVPFRAYVFYFQMVGCDKDRVGYIYICLYLPKTSRHRSPEWERLRKKRRATIFCERTRKGHRYSQTNIGAVSTATLGKPLRDGVVQNGVWRVINGKVIRTQMGKGPGEDSYGR